MSPLAQLGLVFVVVAIATAGVLFPVRAVLARARVVDKPNARSSHVAVTVRGAGIAIIAVVGVVLSWLSVRESGLWFATIGFIGLALVSFVDDLKGLGAHIRFPVHGLAALLALVGVGRGVELPVVALLALGVVSWLWITGYTNAFNFMDGINGIAGVQAVVTGAATAIIAIRFGLGSSSIAVLLSMCVAGAAFGFLPHNFPRARVFMGDVGSAPLGYILAVLAVWIAAETRPWVLGWIALLHANFVLDTAITMTRRALRGERVWEAHREHFYQRLVRAGFSHTSVTLTEFALQALVAVAVSWATPNALRANAEVRMQNGEWMKMGVVAVGVVCVWLAFFAFAEMRFRSVMAKIGKVQGHPAADPAAR